MSAATVPYPKAAGRGAFAELVLRAQAGDPVARNQAIACNMRLVVTMARRLARSVGRLDLVDDLVQAGVAGTGCRSDRGLVRAIASFSPERGTAFSTYARAWIRSAMLDLLADDPAVPVGRHMFGRYLGIRRVAARLAEGLGRPPTTDEIRADYVTRGHVAPTADRCTRALSAAPVYESVSDDLPVAVADQQRADDLLAVAQDRARLLAAVKRLPERERYVIEQRFGLVGGDSRDLAPIGRDLGLSRERARQIEGVAIKALRRILDAAA